ncbi:hypothetical protein ELQ90_00145 [Labedella phragmitis]|uniref:Uncharacterized protein n=1 Tax=Labedella phragmitis TaxID=2498849 RepID=A0A3S3ZCD5_9MICO|nr:hypothetical protein [Labedella phragmitis]RWZ52415.1 hypothetical protein ELQ90_00145 [Labedella phragmitis]
MHSTTTRSVPAPTEPAPAGAGRTATRQRLGRRVATLAAAPLAILLAGGVVWQGSQAAFTSTTRNTGNAWSSGRVMLTDDDKGAAAFTVENIVPGQSGQKCIVVTSDSSVAGVVKLYQRDLQTSGQGLEKHITLILEEGTGGSFNDCTGFVPAGTTGSPQALSNITAVDYSTGVHPWSTTGTPGEARTYRATWAFDTSGMTQQQIDALQGASVHSDLVWEFQNTAPQS